MYLPELLLKGQEFRVVIVREGPGRGREGQCREEDGDV